MDSPLLTRRQLARFRSTRVSHRFTDILVIGSGIAGLSASLAAASDPGVEILLVAKSELGEGSTKYAQGGIAAVLEPERTQDALENHVADTLRAGCGIGDPTAVELVVREGVEAVRELISWGVEFDRHEGALHFTREGGHSHPRILHSEDRTGLEIERLLIELARRQANITTLEETFAVDLIVRHDGACCGVLVYRPSGVLQVIWSKRTILATGGAGRLYRETTNPAVTTGDGVAMAFRAGASLKDMEFVQFHPTTLYVAGAERFLITEAVRGEGGRIRDRSGEAFMQRFHPRGELAPRDVVSRGIVQRMKETGDNKVYLDLSGMPREKIERRFPHILKICRSFGIDILHEPIPVRPSAHYTIGGVLVSEDGASDVDGLYAVGEVSCTQMHGANRLGSNSLLEGLVFGRRAGRKAATEASRIPRDNFPFEPPDEFQPGDPGASASIDVDDLQRSLKSLLWRSAGIERSKEGLLEALEQVEEWISYVLPARFRDPAGWTLQNMLTTGYLIVRGALRREESRGVHYRSDFPDSRDEWKRHQVVSRRSLAEEADDSISP